MSEEEENLCVGYKTESMVNLHKWDMLALEEGTSCLLQKYMCVFCALCISIT